MNDSTDNSNPFLLDPDVQLMIEFQGGNKAAFETLMTKYFGRLLNFIFRYTANREIAEDLTQEVFIKVYKSGPNYAPQAKFQTWLYTIAKNISLNELRKNRRMTVSIDQTFQHEGESLRRQIKDEKVVSPDRDAMQNELMLAVKKAIHELPENQRMAVILRRYDKFSYEEIAAAMETSVEAVRSLLSRAKENLKDKLSAYSEYNYLKK